MSDLPLWTSRVRVIALPGSATVRLDRRAALVCAVLAALLLGLGALALTLGETAITVGQVVSALAGGGDDGVRRIVVQWRLPRVVMAVLGGAALGVSGAVFQSMTRNPLGSPDIIGFSTGAYTGALVASLVLGRSALGTTLGALVGGLGAAVLVYLLAFRGGLQGFRLVVVGIAVSAVLSAVNSYLLVRARLEEAVTAATWGAGSLNGVRWPDVAPVALSLLVLAPACAVLVRRLTVLELGDDHARLLGLGVERSRAGLLVVGVGLIAVVTAVLGPIAFVALAAPQVARRLVAGTGPGLAPAAVVGALLLLGSDVLAQRVVAPGQLPVGVVTGCLGGAYLVWLLGRARRRS